MIDIAISVWGAVKAATVLILSYVIPPLQTVESAVGGWVVAHPAAILAGVASAVVWAIVRYGADHAG